MKRKIFLPVITKISLALMLSAGVIVFSNMSCTPKSACGTKKQHKARGKKIRRMAPSMGG